MSGGDPREAAVRSLLVAMGEDPDREGLRDTPARVVRSWGELFSGYTQKAEDVLRTDFGADGYDQMVLLRDIAFTSTCEHHLLPFSGVAAVGYIPGERVVGLSKLARLVDVHARRLQIQERMTRGIADDLDRVLTPVGVGVVVRAVHSCMSCRGVLKPGASMVTCALSGAMRADAATRAEFLGLVG